MIDLSKYDKQIDKKQLEEQLKSASENSFDPLPEGEYDTELEKLEVGESKNRKLMLTAMYRIKNGPQRNKCMFQNIILFGTKNDGFMIHNAKKLIEDLGFDIEFESYSQFAEEVSEIADSAIGEEYTVQLTYNGEYPRYNIK